MQAQGRRTQPEVTTSKPAEVGSSYRFLVRSAEEAVGAIRDQLGGEARVVSVRSVKAGGVMGFLGNTRLEVIAQVPAPVAAAPSIAVAEEASVPGALAPAPVAASAMPGAAGRGPAAVYGAAAPNGAGIVVSESLGTAPTAAIAAPARRSPPPQRLDALLRRSGLSEQLIARLQPGSTWADADEQPLHLGLTQVAERIRELAADMPIRALPARTAFLGMPGVGRTTALCKWLSAEVFTRGRRGSVASVEFDRQLGAEDLAVFAELLGLEFGRQVPAVGQGAGRDFCYVDVPPLSLTRTEENARLLRFLDEERIPGRVLVVSALNDSALLRRTCTIGVELGCTHLVFTQLDELPQWGKLWDFLIESPLTPLLLSQGPSLSGECETDVVGAVLRRTFPWN